MMFRMMKKPAVSAIIFSVVMLFLFWSMKTIGGRTEKRRVKTTRLVHEKTCVALVFAKRRNSKMYFATPIQTTERPLMGKSGKKISCAPSTKSTDVKIISFLYVCAFLFFAMKSIPQSMIRGITASTYLPMSLPVAHEKREGYVVLMVALWFAAIKMVTIVVITESITNF